MKEASCYNCTHMMVCKYWSNFSASDRSMMSYKNDIAIRPHLHAIAVANGQACTHYEERKES